MEEEISVPETTEESSAPSASETESAPEAEITEVATSEQPAEEVTGEQPKSRIQERIRKLSAEKNYWKDLAQSSEPLEKSDDDSEGVTVDDVARKTAEQVRATIRQEEARKSMLEDGLAAVEKYPELDSDDELAADVIALARGRNISIVQAADRLVANRKSAEEQATKKLRAEQVMKSSATTPQGQKVSTGEPAKVDISTMSESEKEANWNQIIAKMAGGE